MRGWQKLLMMKIAKRKKKVGPHSSCIQIMEYGPSTSIIAKKNQRSNRIALALILLNCSTQQCINSENFSNFGIARHHPPSSMNVPKKL